MKKIVTVLVLLFFITGCFNSEKKLVCKNTIRNETSKYILNSTYKIYYRNNVVTKVVMDETYSSNNQDILNYFEDSLKATYDSFNKIYGGYTYSYKAENNLVVFNTIINYEKVNLRKMVSDKKINRDYTINGKTLSISGIKRMYEKKGAVCED